MYRGLIPQALVQVLIDQHILRLHQVAGHLILRLHQVAAVDHQVEDRVHRRAVEEVQEDLGNIKYNAK